MRRVIIAVATMAVVATGCASSVARMKDATAELQYRDYAGDPIERFTAFDIDSWTPVARNQLVVWTGINDAYLLTVWDNCRDLQFADRIAVSRTGNTVSRFESVRINGDRCPISDIRAVDMKRMKTDRAALRAPSQSKPQ